MIDWSIARLRDDDAVESSERALGFVANIYSCLRSMMDSMRTMFFLLLLLLPFFLFSGYILLLNFWLFLGFINYLREPRKELYSSPSGCMSKPGRRRGGNRGPSSIGRCGWKKKTRGINLFSITNKYKYEEMLISYVKNFSWIWKNVTCLRKKRERGNMSSMFSTCLWSNCLCFFAPCNAQIR